MTSVSVQHITDVSIYNLTTGKTLPGWLSPAQKKALRKSDENYQKRLELIQDFGFPETAQTLSVSPDGRYVVGTGTYPPRVRVWDTLELSMKFERYMDATVVAHAVVSADYSKLAFLQDDRNVELHAAYGRHYRTRVPVAGRSLAWHPPTAELLVGASGGEVYRLSLEEGRFLAPLKLHADSPAANHVAVSTVTALIAAACDGGAVELFDPRSRARAARLAGGGGANATAVAFEEGGLGLAVGTSDAACLVYDLRRAVPLTRKAHPYGLPVMHVAFHRGPQHLVLSADARQVKLWARDGGAAFTNVEAPAKINAVAVAADAPGAVGATDSGLLFAACEQQRVAAYYIPALGTAPKWAAFLDALTDEVDGYAGGGVEGGAIGGGVSAPGAPGVYDDYKFLTREELAELGLSSLIGTNMVKAYMHGFFIDARLHAKVLAVADPHAAQRWRAEAVKAAVEAQRGSRVELPRALPAVNPQLAARLMGDAPKPQRKRRAGEAEGGGGGGSGGAPPRPGPASLLTDDRFAALFSDPRFAIVEDEAEALSAKRGLGAGASKRAKGKRAARDAEAAEEDD